MNNELKDGFSEQVNEIKQEFTGMSNDLSKLGWNILWPLIPLIGLVVLIISVL